MTTTNDVQHMTIERFFTAEAAASLLPSHRQVFETYLREFAIFNGSVCVCRCGRELGGILGSFTWGMVHGEGECGNCGWPARGVHRVTLEGRESPAFFRVFLPYHPDFVETVTP